MHFIGALGQSEMLGLRVRKSYFHVLALLFNSPEYDTHAKVSKLQFLYSKLGWWYALSVQFSRSVVSNSATPWVAAHQASLSITNSRSLLRLMSIESVMPSSLLILCRPLVPLPPIPAGIRVFSNESTLAWGGTLKICYEDLKLDM